MYGFIIGTLNYKKNNFKAVLHSSQRIGAAYEKMLMAVFLSDIGHREGTIIWEMGNGFDTLMLEF